MFAEVIQVLAQDHPLHLQDALRQAQQGVTQRRQVRALLPGKGMQGGAHALVGFLQRADLHFRAGTQERVDRAQVKFDFF